MTSGADPRVAAILAQFRTLPRQSRREVCNEIIKELQPHERREVMFRHEFDFRTDILGNVPMEVAALIAGHLNEHDVFPLQSVSRRWQQVLSSVPVYMAVIRTTMGQEALDAIDHGASSDFQHTLLSLIKRKLRIQSGWPDGVTTTNYSRPWPDSGQTERNGDSDETVRNWDCSDGVSAWIDPQDESFVIFLDLHSKQELQLTTENRESLVELRLSQFLVAAVSKRHCHVWNIQTRELRSFRIPSQNIDHFVANGVNVVLSCGRTMIHWNLDENIARTMAVDTDIVLLAVHPSKSQFTLIRLGESDLEEGDSSMQTSPSGPLTCSAEWGCHLISERFALDDANTFHLIHSHKQYVHGFFGIGGPFSCQQIHRGQSTWFIALGGYPNMFGSVYLSLNPADDRVTFNILPRIDLKPDTIVCVIHGVLYAFSKLDDAIVTLTIVTPALGGLVHPRVRLWDAHKEGVYNFGDGSRIFVDNRGGTPVVLLPRELSDDNYVKKFHFH